MAVNTQDRVYTLDISGIAVLSFPAATYREAQSLLKEDWLRSDLRALKCAGVALWDGKSKLSVRFASQAEAAKFDRELKNLPGGDELPIVYHVALY